MKQRAWMVNRFFSAVWLSAMWFMMTVQATRAQEVAYEKYRLDNGMTVILHQDHSLPVACINIWYYVGAKDELPGRSGFAHLFEHLMFMGTERVAGGQFDQIMEAGGGWNNASTGWDRTNYFSFGPSRLLPTLLWLDADRLEDLGRMMTREKLDKQRDVVRNERRQTSEMQPYGQADLLVSELMYPLDHPYHYDVIGTHADLRAATVQDVKNFFATYYLPNNASLVVAGDFDPEEIKPLIGRLFGTIPRGPDPPHAESEPVRLDGPKRVTLTDKVQFPRLSLIYHSPAAFAPGDAEMNLAAEVLGSGKSSRLYQRLVYQGKLASQVRVGQASQKLGSLFAIVVTARPGVSLDRIEEATDEVIETLRTEGPRAEELERIKAAREYAAVSRLQSILRKADQLNRYNYFLGEPDGFRRDLDRYRRVTPADVRRWALERLDPNARLVMRVMPESQLSLRAARDRQPPPAEARPFNLPEPEITHLSNGIEIRHWQRSDLPLVQVSLLLRGGAVQLDGAEAGRADLAIQMLDEGAGERSAVEFADALERLGARFTTSVGRVATTIDLSVLRSHLEGALDLYADAILRPSFVPQEWQRVKTLHLQALERAKDRAGSVAQKAAMEAFFGKDHPYGRPVEGSVESVENLTLDAVMAAYRRLAEPSNAVFFVAGDLTTGEARDMLESRLGAWRTAAGIAPIEVPVLHDPAPQQARVILVDRPGSVQTVVRYIMPAPHAASPARVELDLLNTILGGSFTSRLNQNLREQHGYTYGARSRYVMEPWAGYMMASADVQAEVTGAALREFAREFARVRGGDISTAELLKAQETNRVGMIDRMQGIAGLIGAAQGRETRGLPFSSLEQDLAAMVKVTAPDLNALAPGAVPVERSVLVLVGDARLVTGQLEGLGLPPPEIHDDGE